ncbi:hypothetical protein GJV76_15030 [Myroides sp. BIT-d1]|uniref:DUF8202 domain-containing protein n=1 Tax=Myroides albus TaxID=2562892 RepID=A0A6I3LLF2_9FLAO|nr:hypothetical protein [Myroides albus]MTG99418.1 hypothetical protein [Myroides albus]
MKRFFTVIVLLCSLWSMGQTPGGINGVTVEYWLKAGELLPTLPEDEEDVTNWNDVSGNNRHFVSPTAFHPRFVKSAMNYQPAVDFYFLDEEDGGNEKNNKQRKLESISDFVVDSDRSYFVIWISRLDEEHISKDASVFAFTAGINDFFGWNRKKELLSNVRGALYAFSGTDTRKYGIGMSLIPNKTGSTALEHTFYLNGEMSSTGAKKTLYNRTGKSVLGKQDGGNSDSNPFFGEVMEVIVMSKPAGSNGVTLTADEIKKINSYLSLKYGLTLNSNSQKDYILSDGTLIYNSILPGYNEFGFDIFGLVRDDNSGLYQKQSMSTEHPIMGAFLGELAETNDENTSTLDNNVALVFGGNGKEGNSSYSYKAGTAFMNYTLKINTDPETGVVQEERLSSLENYVYRAKLTGKSSLTVNFTPNKGQWILVSEDPSFNPSTTKIYKIKGGVVKDVEIKDGDYIGFTYYLQAPGGVTNGLRMWLNASEESTIVTNEKGEVLIWEDYAGLGTSYKRRTANKASAVYLKAEERTNYHPTLRFDKENDYLITDKAPMSVAAPSKVSFYTVVNHDFASTRSYFIGFGRQTYGTDGRRPAFGVYRDGSEGKGRIGSTGLSNTKGKLFNPGATTIAGYIWNVGSDVTFEFDAHAENVKHTYDNILMNGPGMLGMGSSSKTYYLQGVMPEVVAYETILTQNERDRINSYLGLKYGITLKIDKASVGNNYEYLFSDGTSIWEGNDAVHNQYHHNVAAVLRDDDANLNNRQSRSTDVGAIVHMGVGTKLGIDPELDNIKQNKTSISWGHNDGSFALHSFAGNDDVCGEMDSRLEGRIWLVDNESFDQSIMVAAHGPTFPFNGANYKVYLLIADSAEKLIDNKWDRIVPMFYNNEMHVANYKFTDEYTYFTFGAKQVGTCEGCEFEGVKKLDFTKANWKTKGDKGPKVFDLGDGFKVNMNIIDSSNNLNRGYPRTSSLKTLRESRRGGAEVTTEITFTNPDGNEAAASASFELFDIDRTGRVVDIVQVIGYCNGSPVYPKLNYTYNKPDRSRYKTDNSGNANAKRQGEGYSGNSSYTNKRGRVFVEFENPVQKIDIVYKSQSSSTTYPTSYIGIGPMEFYCPAPLPEPNEDGLIFVKQGTAEVLLCEVVDYTFRSVNTNCAPKEVNFTDTLPEGMVWVNNSFSAGGVDLDDANITGYGTRTLTVNGLMVPGGGSLYTFRANAIFEEDALAGTYENRATIDYDRLGTPVTLQSTDRLTGKDMTETIALDSDRPKQILTSFTTNKGCFTLDKENEVLLNIDNPNDFDLADMFLSIDYDIDAFSFVNGSLATSTGLNIGTNQSDEGGFEFEGFKVPKGTSWVKFKVKASNNLADYDVDPATGDPRSITFSFDLISESEDVCIDGALANANGEIELPYCSICYYPSVVGDKGDILNSDGFMTVSTLNRPDSQWVSERGNAFVVLESYNKGLVVTRLTTAQISALNPVEGMIVYDSTENCLKLYNGSEWGCIAQGCVDE